MNNTEKVQNRTSKRRRAILLYVGVAYGVTWLVWLPYLRAAASGNASPGPFLYYLAAGGPIAGALVAESYERGWVGVRDLIDRLLSWRRPGWWVVVGLISPLLLIPLAVLPPYLATGAWPDWQRVGVSGRAPGLGPLATWLLMTVSYGVGEEAGWRGFLLPRLQAGRSALGATVLLTGVWAAWHLPSFAFREGYVGLGPIGLAAFVIGLGAGAIVLTALYNGSRGSILVVALWHGTWNWVAISDAFQGIWVAVMTAFIMIAASVIVFAWGPRELAPCRRPTVPTARRQ